MEKPMLCFCFTWIVFIELNFTVAFLLIRKTRDGQFTGKVRGWGILRNEGGGGGGGDIPLQISLYRLCNLNQR